MLVRVECGGVEWRVNEARSVWAPTHSLMQPSSLDDVDVAAVCPPAQSPTASLTMSTHLHLKAPHVRYQASRQKEIIRVISRNVDNPLV